VKAAYDAKKAAKVAKKLKKNQYYQQAKEGELPV
jgi:hypothetical protein